MNYFIEKTEALMEFGGIKKDVICLLLSGAALLCSIFDLISLPFDAAWVAIILCGTPIILEAAIGMITAFDIKADLLVSLALIASVCIGEDFAAGEVAFIMQLGALLEDLTVANTQAGIEKLVHLTPQTARVLSDDGESVTPAEQVRIGDRIRVLPGETVPVDGLILSGSTSINQAIMTGESLTVDKAVGDQVNSGTVNQFGTFEMEAVKVGEDSSIQRMIRLVQSADAGKAKIVGTADRWASWIVVIALSAAVLTWLISGEVIRAVTILVVFCPCALVLAIPTAIVAAIGNATRHGFLVREGDALERLAKVSTITFDKTVTLTCGTPRVTAVKTLSTYSEEELYQLAAAAEQHSEHPLGKAVVLSYQHSHANALLPAEHFIMTPGKGVCALVDGKEIKAGNLKSMQAFPSACLPDIESELHKGATIIYISIEDKLAGYLVLSDVVRAESKEVLQKIRALSAEPLLLTGDSNYAATAIGHTLGIQEIPGNCLPEDKLNHIDTYQKSGADVCMVGDGVNDTPALKKSQCWDRHGWHRQ